LRLVSDRVKPDRSDHGDDPNGPTQQVREMREDAAVFNAATLDLIRDVASIAVSDDDAETRNRLVAE
jgi:hypothetical protein